MAIKIIVAGGREFKDYLHLREKMDALLTKRSPEEIEIVSGRARGADSCGERYAEERGLKLILFPADWDLHGKAAGFIRNEKMAEYATHLVLFWDGVSRGSRHMLEIGRKKGLITRVIKY